MGKAYDEKKAALAADIRKAVAAYDAASKTDAWRIAMRPPYSAFADPRANEPNAIASDPGNYGKSYVQDFARGMAVDRLDGKWQGYYTPEVRAAVEVFEVASAEKARLLTNAIGRPIRVGEDACVIAGIEAVLDAEIKIRRRARAKPTACPMPPCLCNCDWCLARSGDCNCIKCDEIKNADSKPVNPYPQNDLPDTHLT